MKTFFVIVEFSVDDESVTVASLRESFRFPEGVRGEKFQITEKPKLNEQTS